MSKFDSVFRPLPRLGLLAVATFVAAAAFATWQLPAVAAEDAVIIPPPSIDEKSSAATEKAVFAGGCFWGVQGVFQHVKGVTNAVSGYTGGSARTAHYDMTHDGTSGHAESVEITYDPKQITYGQLLQIFFSVAHDPTQLNRQGPDVGSQYRSTIFPRNQEQSDVAKAYIAQLDQAKLFKRRIVTPIEAGKEFFPAEKYHQDYLVRNTDDPYILYNDLPKLRNLKKILPDVYRDKPVLVSSR